MGNEQMKFFTQNITLFFVLLLTACSGSDETVVINTYTIGGTVSGLEGSGMVLQNNGTDDLTISGNGDFIFAATIVDDNAYSVTVATQPGSPVQACAVTNGSGTLAGAP